ncbi:hypothetical protein NDU88_001608 [Pleurodeles waltl]|uniref:Uncharacterized protein n=1 Tax=Pleurodeles waltl TaxID=8319 RepID=A0AAV7U8E7_PLEWA|nr:hypothetical protein NDU88_001608 [Pleurodeles waltl]
MTQPRGETLMTRPRGETLMTRPRGETLMTRLLSAPVILMMMIALWVIRPMGLRERAGSEDWKCYIKKQRRKVQ